MRRVVGDGTKIKFWEHDWGHGFLSRELPILYEEATDKNGTVQQAFRQNFSDLDKNGTVQQAITGTYTVPAAAKHNGKSISINSSTR